ncbi:hypothetical protein BAOM_3060 [Peribacillus asahii]|uniref:Uncharacterized protein n=1 Tax=Peribacillus asahii TaxID=228899 RepID=A0A3T0KTA6_9BACI|nr:hypothetical protein [Peribacillus asahii]AZV43669.1 hypothetical protein BAOM_3060 [Peribacillus asahii]
MYITMSKEKLEILKEFAELSYEEQLVYYDFVLEAVRECRETAKGV